MSTPHPNQLDPPGQTDLRQVLKAFTAMLVAQTDRAVTTAPTITEGTRLGAYVVQRRIGTGGFGTVFDGAEVATNRPVAIKVLHCTLDHLFRDSTKLAQDEVLALAAVRHAGIVKLHTAGVAESGEPYIVMERVNGIPIDAYCRRHRLQLRQRVALIRQVCLALAAAARVNLVHRDIKPENILVTAEGTPKLIDFGLARELRAEHRTTAQQLSVAAITPAYASPEQLLRAHHGANVQIDHRSDIYSLAAVLYALVVGHPPPQPAITPARSAERPERVRNLRAPLASRALGDNRSNAVEQLGLSTAEIGVVIRQARGGLEAVIQKATQPQAKDRYIDAVAMGLDLQSWLDGQSLSVSRFPRTARLFGRAKPWLVAAGVMVAVSSPFIQSAYQRHRQEVRWASQEPARMRAALFAEESEDAQTGLGPDADRMNQAVAVDLLKEWRDATSGSPGEPEAAFTERTLLAAYRCARLGQLAETNAILDEALNTTLNRGALSPRYRASLLICRARGVAEQGDFAGSLIVLEQLETLMQQAQLDNYALRADLALQRGAALTRLERPTEAIGVYQRAISGWPEEVDIEISLDLYRLERALCNELRIAGRSDEARAVINTSINRMSRTMGELHPCVLDARLLDAQNLVASLKPAEAVNRFEKAFKELARLDLDLSKRFIEPRIVYGHCLHRLGLYREAQAQYLLARKALERFPDIDRFSMLLPLIQSNSERTGLLTEAEYFAAEERAVTGRGKVPILPPGLWDQMYQRSRMLGQEPPSPDATTPARRRMEIPDQYLRDPPKGNRKL